MCRLGAAFRRPEASMPKEEERLMSHVRDRARCHGVPRTRREARFSEPALRRPGNGRLGRSGIVIALGAAVLSGAACSGGDDGALARVLASATVTGLATVAQTDPATGFPYWYGDGVGVRLQPCVDPADPCVAGATVPDPTQPAQVPANFPSEGFYFDAVAKMNVNGGGKATLTLAVESAFGNLAGVVAAGDQITFQRINLKVSGGLTPGQTYTITHPYGVDKVVADSTGAISAKAAGARYQLGCGLTPPACDFGLALGGRVGPFLRRDPADRAAPPTPAGFLGDGVNTHRVIGSPFGTNIFQIAGRDAGGPGISSVSTNQFTVVGKIAGPLLSSQDFVVFGSQPVGSTSVPRTLVITNVGPDPITARAPTMMVGSNFVVAANNCTAPLPVDASCTIAVAFKPTSVGALKDSLLVLADSAAGPVRTLVVPVSGPGAPAATAPAVALNVHDIAFPDAPVGQPSAPASVVISNVGSTTLHVGAVALTGAQPMDFAITSPSCGDIPAGGSCTLTVIFSPIGGNNRTATLVINDDAPDSPQSVTLHGVGHPGLVAFGPIDAALGFPGYYEDSAGTRLELCLDPAQPCVVGSTVPDPTLPPSVPDNFPAETFYYDAVATMPVGPQGAGKATLSLAVEAAFGNAAGVVALGDQITFQRINLKVSAGLVPGETYVVTHPYGTDSVVADGAGAVTVRVPGARSQVGCGLVPPACDFALALRGRVGPFLQRDPSDLTAPPTPAGFIGDGVNAHRVLGSPLGTNFFQIAGKDVGGPGVGVARIDAFTLVGKLAGPLVVNKRTDDFGTQPIGTMTPDHLLTVTNVGSSVLTITNVTTTGAAAADFVLTSASTCVGAMLSRDAACTVAISFHPGATGIRTATLLIAHDGLFSPVTVALTGTGADPTVVPTATVTPASLTFGSQLVGTASATQLVIVNNTGPSQLLVSTVTRTGANAADFSDDGGCAGATVPPGGSCTVAVRFAPASGGAKTANLVLSDNTAQGAHTVSLSGSAIADTTPPTASLHASATAISPNGDGRNDVLIVSGTFSEPTSWVFRIINPNVSPPATLFSTDGTSASMSATWDGRVAGKVAANGNYLWQVTGADAAGNPLATVAASVAVDTQAPVVRTLTATPATFRPSQNQVTSVAITVSEAATVTLTVLSGGKTTVATLTGSVSPAGTVTIVWDGRDSNGAIVPPATYSLSAVAVDPAQNQSGSKGGAVTVTR